RIRTRRGYSIEGALKHRVQLADGTWAYLKDLKPGDRLAIETGADIWPKEKYPINFLSSKPDVTLNEVAAIAGVSLWTVLRHMKGRRTLNAAGISSALKTASYRSGRTSKVLATRLRLQPLPLLNEDVAWLLGYFIGDGNGTKSGICFTCGDYEYAMKLAAKT